MTVWVLSRIPVRRIRPAYDFEDQIDEQTKQDRYDIIMREQLHIAERKNQAFVGKRITVLCEAYDAVAEIYYGRSAYDSAGYRYQGLFPECSRQKRIAPGTFVEVDIEEAVDYDLVGKAVI